MCPKGVDEVSVLCVGEKKRKYYVVRQELEVYPSFLYPSFSMAQAIRGGAAWGGGGV